MKLLILAATLTSLTAGAAARYEVPVTDESLKPFAVSDLADAGFTVANDTLEVHYRLPEDLTGTAVREIQLAGTRNADGSFTLKDPKDHHSATCSLLVDGVTCRVIYGNLDFSKMDTEQFLSAKYATSSAEKNGKTAVFQAFQGDPVGIATIENGK
jgi:hypothetical protein